jgi:hypothetical protein
MTALLVTVFIMALAIVASLALFTAWIAFRVEISAGTGTVHRVGGHSDPLR